VLNLPLFLDATMVMDAWMGPVEGVVTRGGIMRHWGVEILLAAALWMGAGAAAHGLEVGRDKNAAGAPAAAVDVLLDGGDWRMGSFEFGEGVKAGAESEKFDDSGFRTVTVPGDTQLQLGYTGEEPFNESKELIEVNSREWWYRKHFKTGAKAEGAVSRLVFDGSDYFTTVWLNGQLLGTHAGTYTAFSFDVTRVLRYGEENVIAVLVTHPVAPEGGSLLEYLDGNLGGEADPDGMKLKNAPYYIDIHWDALPAQGNATFVMGIWRNVHLRTENVVVIGDLHVETESIAADGSATLRVGVMLKNAGKETRPRTVTISLKPENFSGAAVELPALVMKAAPGETTAEMEVRVPDARLWWSWDKGAQNLYSLEAGTGAEKGDWGDRRSVVFGIRTITRDADMAYRLNGRKMFVKASWFPIADFYRSTPTSESYERDLRLFRDGNFNLLVNFTVVEKPEFYELCDRLGIMVVVELPFPQYGPQQLMNEGNPMREPFLKQAGSQVREIVTALRNHPSVVEWAPLAEAHEKAGGWSNGVDQQGYDAFMAEMNGIVSELAPGSIFHTSLCDLGEQHFWYAAAGMTGQTGDYQEMFDAKTGFVSEYGGISMSSYENLGKYLTAAQQWDEKASLPRWFNLPIDTEAYAYLTSYESSGLYSMLYRTEHFVDRDPKSVAELVSDTQVYQGFLLRYAAEAFRRKKYDPINGIRSWDFLELNPGFRFGIVDYDRVPKTAYWYMKRAQAPVALSFEYKDALESQTAGSRWSAPVWVINDLDREIHGTVHAELLSLSGEKMAVADFPVVIGADGKGVAGEFALTLPQTSGVYVLRATMDGGAEQAAEETSFIKVVPAAFSGEHRVLLIAQQKFAGPIGAMLRGMGVDVDVYDENSLAAMGRVLVDGAALRAKYDAIWLGSFQTLAKVLPAETAKALGEAVKAGTGFIHTGGESSFHGGLGRAALVEATALDAVLPVEISGRADLEYGAHGMDDGLQTENAIHEIATGKDAGGVSQEGLELLRRYGLVGFNRVTARPGSHTELSIVGEPLLVTGMYGAGKTVAFTGFTPVTDDYSALPVDEYLIAEPRERAYFVLFADMLAAVMPGGHRRTANLLRAHEKPLFQTLKELPETEIAVTEAVPVAVEREVARCRVRLENRAGYAHLVHLRVEWAGDDPQPYLSELNDNDFELMPHESRDLELEWRNSKVGGRAKGALIVKAANSTETRLAF
jgi:beta-mannosidase